MPHVPEINITNQYCTHPPAQKGLSHASSSPHPLISLTPQGSNRTPYLTLNLGHPCISVYLLLTVKAPVVLLFSVSPLPQWNG